MSLQVSGEVRRLDFAMAIDRIENAQLKPVDTEEAAVPVVKLHYDVDPDEPFSIDREREVIDLIKEEIEQCVNLADKAHLGQKVASLLQD
jgi:hypothetical protein